MLSFLLIRDYEFEVICSYHPHSCGRLNLPALATLFLQGKAMIEMARALEETARLDRRWFRVHPERRHRCRRPDTSELALYDISRGGRLVIAIRHLGRGRVVYQPVVLHGALPSDERSAAVLFALAASRREPIPAIAATDRLRLRHLSSSNRLIEFARGRR
jgi:hypothetical protein